MSLQRRGRRSALRAPLNRPVKFAQGGKEFEGKGIEVGTGGMSLWCTEPLPAGTMTTVSFTIPGRSIAITAMARVVWSRQPARGRKFGRMGLQFVALERRDRQAIHSFVNKLARNYRDLHIMLSTNKWQLEQLRQLASKARLEGFSDVQELKRRVARALEGFRA
ncbi:MAG: hypothetical protein D6806_10030 [Deltaproteobacteria bacterium]|nr:MAG: hypothetical protein D6806_10030 [Deltaproteobacteria bacterium]